ncbi:MAG: secretin N-terminal domain-containing protein [Planctomycetota bacterium]
MLATPTLHATARWVAATAVGVGLLLGPGGFAGAAEPELVGGLALALDPEAGKELDLSDEQRTKLFDIADQREMDGVSAVMAARGLSKDERLQRLAPYRAESLRLGMQVLDGEQQAKLAELMAASDNPLYQTAEETEETPADDAAGSPAEGQAEPPSESPNERMAEPPVVSDAAPEAAPPTVAIDEEPADDLPTGPTRLRFSFRYQPWQDVLDWFAEQADLSLVLEAPPPGTFNYQDTRLYSVGEALDVLNSVLLTKGYSLVRKGRMLLLVNLEDGIPPNLVTDVPLDELDERGEYELVRVLFRVRNVVPAEAAEELEPLMGPQGKLLVLPKASMIQVTETAGRIRVLRDVIEAFERPGPAGGDLREYGLQYAMAEDILPVLRQLLGIPADSMTTPSGSLQLAVDPLGMKLFAQGSAVQTRRLEEVLKLVDVPESAAGAGVGETPQLEVYPIATIDPELVLNVLQVILGGNESTRLATDAQTGNLVALATPTEHATIRATLQQMQQDSRQVEVIPLSTVDPQIAVLSINKLFTNPAMGDEPDPRAPIVDADLSTGSLMVRASPGQLEQIKDFLSQLGEGEDTATGGRGGNVRMLPIDPSAARSALAQVEQVWPLLRRNRIRVVTPSAAIPEYRPSEPANRPATPEQFLDELLRGGDPLGLPPRRPSPPSSTPPPTPSDDRSASTGRVPARFAQQSTDSTQQAEATKRPEPAERPTRPGAEIVVAPGPGGVMIASDDLEALDAFEDLLRNTAGSASLSGRQLAIFYLKHEEATTAAEILAKVFGASGSAGGGLVEGIAEQALGGLGGGLMGDLLGLGGDSGAGGFSSTAVDIVPDVRLNALVVYAQPTDLDTIDQLLRVLDQRAGPEPVEAGGKPRLIPVVNTSATAVAEVVKQVFSDRLQGGGGSGGGGGRQPNPEELIRMLRRAGGGGGGGSTDQEPSKMTLGVDTRSNSLVVRAPDPLFQQVEQLVRQLDEEGLGTPQATRIVSLKHTSADALKDTLISLLGAESVTTSSGSGGGGGSGEAKSNDSKNADQQKQNEAAARETMQRIEMFRRMREMQQRAGGGRGGPPGRGGGDAGGRGGGGGRGGRGR